MELNKDNLYQKYITENLRREECARIFKCSESLISKRLKIYNIKKDINKAMLNRDNTMISRYGVANPSLLDTNVFKVNNPSKDPNIKAKSAKTFKRKYTKEVEIKKQKTNLKRYGCKTFAESKYFKDMMANKAKLRNNYDILYDKNKFLDFIKSCDIKPTIYELSKLLNYSYTTIGRQIRVFDLQKYIDSKKSQPNIYWHDLILKELDIDLKYEGYIFGDKERCDLYDENNKIAIDINPTASHNTQFNVYTRKPMGNVSVSYHRNRSIKAEHNGWLLYQIYDWDNEEKVLFQLKNLFKRNEIIYARKCKVLEISKNESKMFLDKYHLQGNIGSTYEYGLYYNNELVSVMTFGKTRFDKRADIELLRYCSKNTIIGGASKLFKYATNKIKCKNIITYSSMDKGSGNLYKILGFDFIGYAGLNAMYAPERPTGECLKTQAASFEYKKYGVNYSSCKEYFNSMKWYRINDAGSKIWIWNNPNYNSEN